MQIINFIKKTFVIAASAMIILAAAAGGSFLASQSAQASGFQNIVGRFRALGRQHNSAASVSAGQVNVAASTISPGVVFIYGYSKQAQAVQSQTFFSPRLNSPFPVFSPRINFANFSPAAVKTVAGTGFFVSADGYIVTNKHVVIDAAAIYEIDLPDGGEKIGHVVYRDPSLDLALIKISGNNYPVLPLGDSSAIGAGDTVLSIGNAFGRGQGAVSAGKVLAVHQDILAGDGGPGQNSINDTIETSAQLYPGDSGGPTFNLAGQVIGINVAMSTDQPNDSFSIPINYVKDMVAMATGNK